MKKNNLIIYQDEDGVTKISVRFSEDDVWVTQQQLAEVYNTSQQNISYHIDCIYDERELSKESTHKKYLLVRTEGERQVKRNIDHYNLDLITAIDIVCNQVATRCRR